MERTGGTLREKNKVSCSSYVIKKTAKLYVLYLGFKAVEYLEYRKPHIFLYRDKTEIRLKYLPTESRMDMVMVRISMKQVGTS